MSRIFSLEMNCLTEMVFLTVNKEEAIAALKQGWRSENVDLKVARPGRVSVFFRSKQLWSPVTVPIAAVFFQAIQGLLFLQGEGVVYAPKDMSVLAVGKRSIHGMNGMVDMAGPGLRRHIFKTD